MIWQLRDIRRNPPRPLHPMIWRRAVWWPKRPGGVGHGNVFVGRRIYCFLPPTPTPRPFSRVLSGVRPSEQPAPINFIDRASALRLNASQPPSQDCADDNDKRIVSFIYQSQDLIPCAALSAEVSLQPQQPLGDKVKEYSTHDHHADHHYRN
jgi:hypothetical protein